MQIGDKITVIKNPNNKTNDGTKKIRYYRSEQKGILDSVSSNVIVIKHKNYRESFNSAEIIEGRVEIRDKNHNKLTIEGFKEMLAHEE